jgi:hypothetical protein
MEITGENILSTENLNDMNVSTNQTIVYNFSPLQTLIGKIEADILLIDTEFEKKLEADKQIAAEKLKREEAENVARLAREEAERLNKLAKEEQDRIKKVEAERKAKEAKDKADALERKRLQLLEEQRQAELKILKEAELKKKQAEELERLRLAELKRVQEETEEAERKAALKKKKEEEEEAERRDREEYARRLKEESERKLAEQKVIDELLKEYKFKLKEMSEIAISPTKKNEINVKLKDLDQLITSKPADKSNLELRIKLLDEILKDIDKDKAKTISDVKDTPEYKVLLKDIIFIMKSFNKKTPGQKEAIINIKGNNKTQFDLIKKLYDEAEKIEYMTELISNIDTDNFIINNYNDIIDYIKNTINTDENKRNINKISDIYEIIVGTARVSDRFKPDEGDNTAPEITQAEKEDYNAKTYFDNLITPTPIASGGNINDSNIIQKGGYNYEDIIKVVGRNQLEIGATCKPDSAKQPYGPFYSIYPPQYNNFHIYYNMFGINPFNQQPELESNENDKYDKLLKEAKFNKGSNGKFDVANIDNQPHNLMKKLEEGGSVVIFGFGFSGSGKTYALIEGSENPGVVDQTKIKYDPSILEQFIKSNSESIASVEFIEIYPLGVSHNPHHALDLAFNDNGQRIQNNKIISSTELTENVTQKDIEKYASEYGIEITENDKKINNLYSPINSDISYKTISTRIKLLERHRISKLRILSTPNNDKSSRSFLQITINLIPVKIDEKEKIPKLVFFDMPGTENTVRIKTEFLDKTVFDELEVNSEILSEINTEREARTNNGENPLVQKDFKEKKRFSCSNFILKDASLYDIFLYKTTVPKTFSQELGNQMLNNTRINYFKKKKNIAIKNSNYKDTNEEICFVEIKRIFKFFFMQKMSFEAIRVDIAGDDEIVAFDSLEFALFINGHDIKREKTFEETYNNIPDNTKINFLNNRAFTKIFTDFEIFLNKTKYNKNLKENENIYFNLEKTNKYCKIPYFLDDNDKLNLKNIFNITFKDNGSENKDNTKIYFINEYTYEITNFINKNKTTKYSPVYFANPLVKYIYFILNYLKYVYYANKKFNPFGNLDNMMKSMLEQVKIRASVFFIYKYINFIVNQGRSIVSNLEHLKFFFLTRTGIINSYNEQAVKEAEQNAKPEINKSFYCSDNSCSTIISKTKEYTKPTNVGTITIQERINVGNMQQYGLIDILQKLSESPLLSDCACKSIGEGNNKFSLNLLEGTGTPESLSSLLGAIFIMFTNYKIFLDDKSISNLPINQIGDKLDTLCTAAKDTAEFTESISSTSTNKEVVQTKPIVQELPEGYTKLSTLYPGIFNQEASVVADVVAEATIDADAIVGVGGKRKFNMNQLLEHKNKKPRTHRNLSFKNKKNKVFYNRTKKNN